MCFFMTIVSLPHRNSLGHKVLGFPVAIDDSGYERNRYIFNLCFVCEASKRTVQYEPLIKKLARYMVQLELECKFLSRGDNKDKVTAVLTSIKDQLNENRSCKLIISKSSHAVIRKTNCFITNPFS